MDYTPVEQNVLSMMQRTDFKNLSKNEVVSYVSKLADLRPEVAREVLAQFPEFAKLVQSTLVEYKGMLDSLIESDDESLKAYYAVADKELDHEAERRGQFYELVKQVQADYSKCLDNPNLPPEAIAEILQKETELIKMAESKDTEISNQEKSIEESVAKKDSEKRSYNWKLVSAISATLVLVVGVGAGVLGGKFDLRLAYYKLYRTSVYNCVFK